MIILLLVFDTTWILVLAATLHSAKYAVLYLLGDAVVGCGFPGDLVAGYCGFTGDVNSD